MGAHHNEPDNFRRHGNADPLAAPPSGTRPCASNQKCSSISQGKAGAGICGVTPGQGVKPSADLRALRSGGPCSTAPSPFPGRKLTPGARVPPSAPAAPRAQRRSAGTGPGAHLFRFAHTSRTGLEFAQFEVNGFENGRGNGHRSSVLRSADGLEIFRCGEPEPERPPTLAAPRRPAERDLLAAGGSSWSAARCSSCGSSASSKQDVPRHEFRGRSLRA